MTLEERVNAYYWWVLSKIKEELETTPTNKPIRYELSHIAAVGVPNNETEENIIQKLEELKALQILSKFPREPGYSRRTVFDLIVLQPKFDEIYNKYRELCDKNETSDEITSPSPSAGYNSFKNVPIKVLIADLTSKYHEVERETNQTQFFIKIAHYGQYILENETTVSVLSLLYQESKNDAQPYLQACKEFTNEWKNYAEDLLTKAKIAGIIEDPNNPLDNDASRLRNSLNLIAKGEESSLWDFDLDRYFTPYQYLAWQFDKIGKSDLLIPKHFDKGSHEFKIHPLYSNARNEWDKFKYSREAKVWWAHYQVCRLATGVLNLKERVHYFKDDNIIDGFYRQEFSQLARGLLDRAPIVLHQNKYAAWIKRLHEYLIPRLEAMGDEQQALKPPIIKPIGEPGSSALYPDKPILGFPYRLPAGTTWEQIIIKFIDEENVFIKSRQYTLNTNYKEMGFADSRGKILKPGVLWTFLKTLAKLNGEITIRDPEAKDVYKKQKELLSKILQSYFRIDYDPFYPYHGTTSDKTAKSYKIKITLIPPPNTNEPNKIAEKPQEELDQEINDLFNEETPIVYEDNNGEKP